MNCDLTLVILCVSLQHHLLVKLLVCRILCLQANHLIGLSCTSPSSHLSVCTSSVPFLASRKRREERGVEVFNRRDLTECDKHNPRLPFTFHTSFIHHRWRKDFHKGYTCASLLIAPPASLLSPLDAFQELSFTMGADIDFQVTGRRTEERGERRQGGRAQCIKCYLANVSMLTR